MEQADEVRQKQGPGLGHVPQQLPGGGVHRLLPVGRVAGEKELPEGLHNVHHVPGLGGGDGAAPAVVVVKGLGHIAHPAAAGHQSGDEGDVLKEHLLIAVLLPDRAAEQLVHAVGDVVSMGDVVRQVHLLPGIGGHHHLPVFLHVEDAHVAHHQIAIPGLGLLVEGLGHLRLDGVVRVQKEQVLPLGQGGPGVAGHAQALVLLVEHPHQAGVFPGVALTDFRAGVGAAVVHQDDFLLRQGLPQGGVHRPL